VHAERTTRAVFWQLAFWPPNREIVVSERRAVSGVAARLQILELHVLTLQRSTIEGPESYPCTYPGCARGNNHPFGTSGHLGNHRLAAHGIRSTNEESIRRQERRDRNRAKELGPAPEYIDRAHIREVVSHALPALREARQGELDAGDREHVRRRLSHFVGKELPRELRRAPAEICLAVAEIAASGLTPTYPKIVESAQTDLHIERITTLFTKTSMPVAM
jgi:hypothetical protein